MTWFFLALLSAISAALARILQKRLLSDKHSNPVAFAILFQLSVAGLFGLYTLLTNSFEVPDLSQIWLNFVLMTLLYGSFNVFLFKAFKLAQASEVTILLTSSTIWTVLSAWLWLDETITLISLLGIALIIASIIVINSQHTNWRKLSRGHLYSLAAAACVGLAFTNDAQILSQYTNTIAYMAPVFFFPVLVTFLFEPRSIKSIPMFLQKSALPVFLACCLLYGISTFSAFSSIKVGGQASLIAPVQQTSLIFTVLFSYLFLNERSHLRAKLIGTALAFAGVLLLVQ